MPVELSMMLVGALCVALVFIPPCLLFRPLILALSDRLRGKHSGGNTQEITALKQRVAILEQELADFRGRVIAVEETGEFAKNLLEKKEKPGS